MSLQWPSKKLIHNGSISSRTADKSPLDHFKIPNESASQILEFYNYLTCSFYLAILQKCILLGEVTSDELF